jgi:hypothetical protein
MTESTESDLLHQVWEYPLFDALFGRRSRRFGLGFEMTEGPFKYKSQRVSLAAFVHIHAAEAMADVTISPGRVGRAEVSIRVVRENFSRFPAKDVRLALEPPTPANQTLEQNAIEQAVWTVRVIVTPKRGEPIPFDAPIVVER